MGYEYSRVTIKNKMYPHQVLVYRDGVVFREASLFLYLLRSESLVLPSGVKLPRAGTGSSADTYRNNLFNFLNFLDAADIDFDRVSYETVVHDYQGEMLYGVWNKSSNESTDDIDDVDDVEEKLDRATTAPRVTLAIAFMEFLSLCGKVKSFATRTKLVHYSEDGITTTAGTLRTKPAYAEIKTKKDLKPIWFPAQLELVNWVEALYGSKVTRGRSFALICDLAHSCGLRRVEAVDFRAIWLEKAIWDDEFGVYETTIIGKGPKERQIQIPPDLYDALCDYAQRLRPDCESANLFVIRSAKACARNYTLNDLREDWERLLPKEWKENRFTFHSLRHFYACYLFMALLKQREESGRTVTPSQLRPIVQARLGHKSPFSTNRYLTWVNDHYFGARSVANRDTIDRKLTLDKNDD